jgi:hypothetical protein
MLAEGFGIPLPPVILHRPSFFIARHSSSPVILHRPSFFIARHSSPAATSPCSPTWFMDSSLNRSITTAKDFAGAQSITVEIPVTGCTNSTRTAASIRCVTPAWS